MSQLFDKGSDCDLDQAAAAAGVQLAPDKVGRTVLRTTDVHLLCSPDSKLRMVVLEPALCTYVVEVYVPALCTVLEPEPAAQEEGGEGGGSGEGAEGQEPGGGAGSEGGSEQIRIEL